jgi:hypothetical protein
MKQQIKIIEKSNKIKMQEIKNPKLEQLKKQKTDYKNLKSDKERLDFIAQHLNL